MTDVEQLRLITPEYAHALSELDSLVASLPNQYPDDIEYTRSGFRLPLRAEGTASDTYFTVTKSLPYPYPENPDWAPIPAQLGNVTEQGFGSGYVTHYGTSEGLLTSWVRAFDNNEFLDKGSPTRELSEVEVRKLIEDLSVSQPIHPDKSEREQAGKTTKIGSFIRLVLFRK